MLVHRTRVAQRRFLRDFGPDFTPQKQGHNWARARQTRRAGRVYFTGLLQPVQVKSMERIAQSGGIPSHRLQQFITDSPWDADRLIESLLARMRHLTSPEGVVIFDDTGQAKQGTHSVGVGRQYSGTLGKVGNCQVAVTALYALPGKERNADVIGWPLGMELYLPSAWTEDAARRRKVGVPEELSYRTKPEIALEILKRVRREGIPHKAVVFDAGYGNVDPFRRSLRELREPYVAAWAPGNHQVYLADWPEAAREGTLPKGARKGATPRELAEQTPDPLWQDIAWGEGTKHQLHGEFVRYRVRVVHGTSKYDGGRVVTDEEGWLLLERDDDELKAYMLWGLNDLTLEQQVALTHRRWVIEQFYREIKQFVL